MKKCIYYLSLLILSSLFACTGSENPENSVNTEVKTIDPTTRIGEVQTAITNTVIDSSLQVKTIEEENETHLKLVIEKTIAFKKAYEESEEKIETYVESIPFTTFLGNEIELGALEIIQFGDQYTRVYADYFNGEPIGGKLFLIENNDLIAVEIIQLSEQTTENGTSIQDENTHVLYYHEEKVLSTIDLLTKKTIEEKSVKWLDENLVDWGLVKEQLNIL